MGPGGVEVGNGAARTLRAVPEDVVVGSEVLASLIAAGFAALLVCVGLVSGMSDIRGAGDLRSGQYLSPVFLAVKQKPPFSSGYG